MFQPLTRRATLATFAGAVAENVRPFPRTIQVGNTQVRLITIYGHKGVTYFHPHENEHTSAVTTRSLVHQQGGSLLEIRSSGARLISFRLAGVAYTFDPNRIFTDVGIVKSLIRYGSDSQPAVNAIKPLRNAVLANLKRAGTPWVAVHNNAPDGMHIQQYRPEGPFGEQTKQLNINPKAHAHDFFLVLEDKLFRQLSQQGFNVAQQADAPPDDGSLSTYCQQHKIRYVNVEAAEGHASEQRRMLEALKPLLIG